MYQKISINIKKKSKIYFHKNLMFFLQIFGNFKILEILQNIYLFIYLFKFKTPVTMSFKGFKYQKIKIIKLNK
jgi:hypothetical protein